MNFQNRRRRASPSVRGRKKKYRKDLDQGNMNTKIWLEKTLPEPQSAGDLTSVRQRISRVQECTISRSKNARDSL